MFIGIGLNIHSQSQGGNGAGVDPGFPFTAPELAFVDATDPSSDTTQDMYITVTAPIAGDEVVTNAKIGGFSTPNDPAEFDVQDVHALSGAEIIALAVTRTLTLTPDGAWSVSGFHKRSTSYSNRSNTVTKTIDTVSFTPTYLILGF